MLLEVVGLFKLLSSEKGFDFVWRIARSSFEGCLVASSFPVLFQFVGDSYFVYLGDKDACKGKVGQEVCEGKITQDACKGKVIQDASEGKVGQRSKDME